MGTQSIRPEGRPQSFLRSTIRSWALAETPEGQCSQLAGCSLVWLEGSLCHTLNLFKEPSVWLPTLTFWSFQGINRWSSPTLDFPLEHSSVCASLNLVCFVIWMGWECPKTVLPSIHLFLLAFYCCMLCLEVSSAKCLVLSLYLLCNCKT